MIDGQTKLLGLIGENIAYTMSPRMHNAAAAALGINAVYVPVSLPAASVAAWLDAAWHAGATGFNVTQPHKTLVASLIPGCALASINTLYRGDEPWWQAASTDGEGFARGLQRLGTPLDGFREIVVLGAGGATAAILRHALESTQTPPTIRVLRRSSAGDAALLAGLPAGARVELRDLSVATLTDVLRGKDPSTLLLQATSAPHRGDDLAWLAPALRDFAGVVADIVYGKPSAIYQTAVAKGLKAQDGQPMLIEQARLSQLLWWGKAAGYDVMERALQQP